MENTSLSERMAHLSFSQKLEYLWNYYKLPIFAIAAVLVIAIWGIWRICNPGRYEVIELVLVNAETTETELPLFDDLLRENGYDPTENMIRVNPSYQVDMTDTSEKNVANYQMLYARFLGNDLDIVVADEAVFATLATQKAFVDVETLLTEAQREKYIDKVIYMEDPDTGEKVSCGILLEDTALQADGIYTGPVIAGIPHVTGDQELALALIFYLLGE